MSCPIRRLGDAIRRRWPSVPDRGPRGVRAAVRTGAARPGIDGCFLLRPRSREGRRVAALIAAEPVPLPFAFPLAHSRAVRRPGPLHPRRNIGGMREVSGPAAPRRSPERNHRPRGTAEGRKDPECRGEGASPSPPAAARCGRWPRAGGRASRARRPAAGDRGSTAAFTESQVCSRRPRVTAQARTPRGSAALPTTGEMVRSEDVVKTREQRAPPQAPAVSRGIPGGIGCRWRTHPPGEVDRRPLEPAVAGAVDDPRRRPSSARSAGWACLPARPRRRKETRVRARAWHATARPRRGALPPPSPEPSHICTGGSPLPGLRTRAVRRGSGRRAVEARRRGRCPCAVGSDGARARGESAFAPAAPPDPARCGRPASEGVAAAASSSRRRRCSSGARSRAKAPGSPRHRPRSAS